MQECDFPLAEMECPSKACKSLGSNSFSLISLWICSHCTHAHFIFLQALSSSINIILLYLVHFLCVHRLRSIYDFKWIYQELLLELLDICLPSISLHWEKCEHNIWINLLPECRAGYSAKGKYGALFNKLLSSQCKAGRSSNQAQRTSDQEALCDCTKSHVHEASSAWMSPRWKPPNEKHFKGVWF